MRLYLILLVILITAGMAVAQPGADWARMYGGARQDYFNDVYASSDGGYVACGRHKDLNHVPDSTYDAWVVKTDEDGDVEWECEMANPGVADDALGIIETDFQEFLAVGKNEGRVAPG